MGQTWPRISRASGQILNIVCGASVQHYPALVGCSTSSKAYLATSCSDGEYSGGHAAVAGASTTAVALASGGSNANHYTANVDASGLLPGVHRVCLDLDG